MRYFITLSLVFFLCSCEVFEDDKQTFEKFHTEVVKTSNSTDMIVKGTYDIYEVFEREEPNLIEPKSDIYLGANINNSYYKNDFEKFESDVEMKHAIYMYDISLNESDTNIQKIVLQSLINNQIPYFSIKYDVTIGFDINKLEELAKTIGQINYYNFVEIIPVSSEHNFDNDEYIKFFRESSNILKKYSPKSNIVFAYDNQNFPFTLDYYVGDEFCDFVSIYFLSNVSDKNINMTLSNIDNLYYVDTKKPILLNLGVSYFDAENNEYNTKLFEKKMNTIYKDVKKLYNNIKAVIYLDYDFQSDKYQDKYNLESYSEAIDVYKTVIIKDYFLSSKVYEGNFEQKVRLPFVAVLINEDIYVDTSYFKDYILKFNHNTVTFDNKLYIDLYDFIKILDNKNIVVNEEDREIIIRS